MEHQASVNEPKAGMVVKMPFEDYAKIEWDGLAEWVDGKVVFHPMPSERHQDLLGFILALLRYFAEVHRLGKVYCEPFPMRTGPDLPGRCPDVLFVAGRNSGRLRKNHLEGPADLAVEIVSPDSPRRDRIEKFAEYQQGGVREYWIIDPLQETADFYTLSSPGRLQHLPIKDDVVESRALPGLWLKVSWLWQEPLPRLIDVMRQWGMSPDSPQ